jgi:hypothetical protein
MKTIRTETLRTCVYWEISIYSVPKRCKLMFIGKFPYTPCRNVANLSLLGNFHILRAETLQT